MNFDLTEEQKMIRDMAGDFAREVILPRSETADKNVTNVAIARRGGPGAYARVDDSG